MKFCANCGTENKEETRFCRECGHDFNTEDTETKEPLTVTIKKPEIKALTKTQKIVGGIVLFIILAGFSGYKIGEQIYSKQNQIDAFIETLASADENKLAKLVVTHDPNFKVTPESLAPFATYLSENKSYVSNLGSAFRNSISTDSKEIYVSKNGKKMFFYDNYELVINPVYFNVSTNVADATITLNGKELLVSDEEDFSKEVGPYAPGKYEFHATADINGYQFENKAKENILSNFETEVYLPVEGVEFSIYSNQENPDVYLNNKKIGQLKDGYGDFGPVSWSDGMLLELGMEFPSGTLKSKSTELYNYDDSYSLDFTNVFSYQDVSDVLFDPLTSQIIYMSESDEEYLDSEDESELASYLTGGKNSELYVRFIEYAKVFRGNKDAESLSYNYNITDITQTDVNLYTVTMDFELTTYYSYSSNRDNLEERYDYTFVVESYEKDDYWNPIGFTLSEITSKVDTLN